MIIQYASDLHLEFPQNREFLKLNPIQPKGDILLLAGDIIPFSEIGKHSYFFDYLADSFQFVYWIPGNHEYYHSDSAEKCGYLNERIRGNVFLINNLSVVHYNVKIILSTLWSKISVANKFVIEQFLNDFHLIKYNGKRFTSEQYNIFHKESLEFIRDEITREVADKTIVVTHHAPTFFNYPEKYKKSMLNEAFTVELFDFIEANGPDYWIYGHTHFNTPVFEIKKTKLLTNQLGYVHENEHFSFINNASFLV